MSLGDIPHRPTAVAVLALACGLALARPLTADPVLIDFEDLNAPGNGTAGLVVDTQYEARGVGFKSATALDFSKGSPTLPGFAHSGTKAIELCYENPLCASPLELDFRVPQSSVGVWVGYALSTDRWSPRHRTVILHAFDASSAEIGQATTVLRANGGVIPIDAHLEVKLTSPSIVKVTIGFSSGSNDGLAVDDVEFAGCPDVTLAPSRLPAGTVNVAYSQSVTASGGTAPYSYTDTLGTLPPGLVVSSTGLVSGTPTTPGSYDFSIRARDANGCVGLLAYTIDVGCGAIGLEPSSLPAGTLNVAYSQTVTARGGTGPYDFRDTLGTLPPGLTVSPAGLVSGTPTTIGNYSFSIRARDANGCAGLQGYTIEVSCGGISLDPSTLPAGTVNAAYSQTVMASGGTAPYDYRDTLGTVPPGLTVSPTGLVSGTPTTAGSYSFSIRARDIYGCLGLESYTIVVGTVTCPAPTITGFTPTRGTVGTLVSIQGSNLSDPTSIDFDGTPAPVESWTVRQIVTRVPAGAVSGPIHVVTCAGAVSLDTFQVSTIYASTRGTPHYVGVGIPFVPEVEIPVAALGLGAPNVGNWRLGHYLPAGGYASADQGLTILEPGLGYWLITWDPAQIMAPAIVAGPEAFRINLEASANAVWNQLANPYEDSVSVAALGVRSGGGDSQPLLSADGPLDPLVWVYRADEYEPVTASGIAAHEAFWVHQHAGPAVELAIPRPAAPAQARAAAGEPATLWSVRISARESDARCLPVVVGALAGGSPRMARGLPPDPPGQRLRLVVAGAAAAEDRSIVSLEPDAPTLAWNLILSSAEAPGEIVLDIEGDAIPSGSRIRLADADGGQEWDVAPGASVTLAATGGPRRLRVTVSRAGDPSHAGVDRAMVYPNPSGARAGVWLTNGQAADLGVSIFDPAGRRLWSRHVPNAPPGEHVFVWDGAEERGGSCAAGVYFVRYRIGARQGTLRLVRL